MPPPAWARGIAAFTIVFAAGQIVEPSLVGAIAGAAGGACGLALGLACSAAVLALGAVLAAAQRPKLLLDAASGPGAHPLTRGCLARHRLASISRM